MANENEGKKIMHWSEQIAQEIIEKKQEPYVISGGLTTSGPTHLGTVCEFLFPQAIVDALKYFGKKAEYYFVADIADSFDSIPSVFEQYRDELQMHLGKPLYAVPDPTGHTTSFGDYFLEDAKKAMEKLGVNPKIVRANELYSDGKMDKYAVLFLKEEKKIKELVAKSSLRENLPDWWSPIMPTCEKCCKNATTRVISHDTDSYRYICDRDVKYTKGCGHTGSAKIADHNYKLTWRLHWPAWQDYFGTSAEGGGVDHFTKGGSRDTLEAVFREIFKKEPPIGYKFGFILFGGKKYSKSKGTGMGVAELMDVLPPEVMKYILLKPDLQENVDIVPTGENLLRAIEDYEKAIELLRIASLDSLSRADRKRALAAKLASESSSAGRGWKTPFLDLILYRSLQWSWDKISEKTGDAESVKKLAVFVDAWEKKKLIPEDYFFSYRPSKAGDNAAHFFSKLVPGMDAVEIHNLVFSTAKELSLQPAKLFEECYLAILGKPKGPKLGKLIEAVGIARIKKDVL